MKAPCGQYAGRFHSPLLKLARESCMIKMGFSDQSKGVAQRMTDVRAFLRDIGFIQTWEEMRGVEETFLAHMEKGLRGEESSLPMLPAYLTVDALPRESRDVIVMDAGGTNLRVSLLRLQPGHKPQILEHFKRPVPGKPGPISPERFFDELAQAVLPVADRSDRIGFCFSFPCRILPNLDGEILYLDKEVNVPGIEGLRVGEGLREALRRLGARSDHRIVILNDTVAALLGALAEHPAECFSGYIGMILGTGTNCCYAEENARILKAESLRGMPGHSIINMEAGAFNGFALTEADVLVNRASKVPDQNLMEKTMSGEYQGKLMDALLRCAAGAGCFSPALAQRIENGPLGFTAADISLLQALPLRAGRLHDLAPEGPDALAVYELADALIERASMMAVMNLVAIMRWTDAGRDPLKPVCVAIEGTTYQKNEAFCQKIRAHLLNYAGRERGYHCRVMNTDEANLVGSAVAAMTVK